MTASTGTTRGGTLFGAAAALAVVAGGAVAALAPVHDTVWPDGPVLLIEWVLLAAVAVWCTELAVARAAQTRTYTDTDGPRALRLGATGILATALTAELILITARCAEDQAYGMAWASGGVLLALFAGATWRSSVLSSENGSGYTPSDTFLVGAAFVLAEACGAWLTARFAVEGPLWAAWALGCAMVALAAGFWLSDSPSWEAESTYQKVFGSVAVLGVAGVVARSAVRGETVAAWWVGGVVVGVPLIGFGAVFLWAFLAALLDAGGRGRAVSLEAQLAGVLVPVASVGWAKPGTELWGGQGSGAERLLGASYLAGTIAVMLVAQSTVLAWTGTAPPRRWVVGLVGGVRRFAPPDAERSTSPNYPYGSNPARNLHYERGRREREERLRNHLADFHDPMSTAWLRLTHPLQSAAVLEIHHRTAAATGLAIDEVWSRLALIVPDQAGSQAQRRERNVLAWRLVVASALCTAGVWLVIALTGVGGFDLEGGSPALLVAGPLLVAAVALRQARSAVIDMYAAKAEAVRLYRYDLARSLRLPVPDDDTGMIRLASELSGSDDDPYLNPYPYPEHRPSPPGAADPSRLAADVAALVRGDIRADVRQAVRDEYASLVRQNPARAELAAPDLAQLARDIAESAAEPVSAHLKSHLTDLQQKFHQDVRATIRSSLEESVSGAPLTNFVGYLAIELDRSAQEGGEQSPVRAEGGTIKAPAGRRVDLVVSVVRDPRAQTLASVVASRPGTDFFVFEPVRVEGGRDAETVSFDAMADSSTLTPLPQRKNLLVTDERQTAFGFRLPAEAGSHEVWVQLYQAAHLVQVVALKIEAEAAPPDEATDEAPSASEATDEATVDE
ncbi:hypothetical protein [Streptomyces liliifuscus]|uniref:Uncharacterized protein n=1 Tax=Streptomyces liliifuscus TaxID=2797636 RepID=A0A7T7I5U9_9ACTN|nr:hypothetical protein [Streptomyces liliifuscus]QQM41413.1 hypothetical protein JEQ17_19400 [Streptomyces liliifuscus]